MTFEERRGDIVAWAASTGYPLNEADICLAAVLGPDGDLLVRGLLWNTDISSVWPDIAASMRSGVDARQPAEAPASSPAPAQRSALRSDAATPVPAGDESGVNKRHVEVTLYEPASPLLGADDVDAADPASLRQCDKDAEHAAETASPPPADRAGESSSVDPTETSQEKQVVGSTPEARAQRLSDLIKRHGDGEMAAFGSELLADLASSVATSASDVMSFFRAKGGSVSSSVAEQISGALRDPGEQNEAPPAIPEPAAPVSAWLVEVGEFSPVILAETVDASLITNPVHVRRDGHELVLSWPKVPEEAVHLYRVVWNDIAFPLLSPELAELVGVTMATEGRVRLPARSAATFFGVWVHSGADEHSARQSPPRQWAKGYLVWPPSDLEVRVTPDRFVAGRFTAPPNATVEIQRSVPGQNPDVYDLSRLLDTGHVARDGFLDREPPLVVAVTYSARTITVVGDRTDTSSPVHATVTVVPEPTCPQLEVISTGRHTISYDLSWVTPAFGRVRVYLTKERPPRVLGEETRTRELLERSGLTSETELAYSTAPSGERTVMSGVSVDPSWVRGYFVATHEINDDFIGVGPIETVVRPSSPQEVSVAERVDSQIILLRWPAGATSVEVYQGPRGVDQMDLSRVAPMANVTEDEYRTAGGIPVELAPNGASVHLYGVVSEGGQRHRSVPQVVNYPGITVVHVRCVPTGADGRPIVGAGTVANWQVQLFTKAALQDLPLTIVSHDERLPLSPHEPGGRVVYSGSVAANKDQIAPIESLPAGPNLRFVRVFHAGTLETVSSVAIVEEQVMRPGLA